jgi:hypothetical protein
MKTIFFVLSFLFLSLFGVSQTEEQKCHFYGAELGFNRYSDPDPSSGYHDLSLNTKKSMYFKLNVLCLDKALFAELNKSGYDYKVLFAYLGLGLKWNNYRFDPNVRVVQQPTTLLVYRDSLLDNTKSKLTIFWVNVPLMLEYQFNYNWFIHAGMEFGARINSHTKYVYLVDGDKKKDKDWNNFGLNNFKSDIILGFGFSRLSLNASYSLVPLFKDGRGPLIHPYSLNLMYVLGGYK